MRWNAFGENARFWKGNIHTHTTLSDGKIEPLRQIALYREAGYDFLSITDHNSLYCPPSWEGQGILMIPGWERNISYGPDRCIHVVGLSGSSAKGRTLRRPPETGETMTEEDLIRQMKEDGNVFLAVAHPVWSRMEPEELLSLKGYDAIEVANTNCTWECHTGEAEAVWDWMLRHGVRVNAVADDDTHHPFPEGGEHFGGWVMVASPSLTVDGILDAMKEGRYYSSEGPAIIGWGVDGKTAWCEASPASAIHFVTYPGRGDSFWKEGITEARMALRGDETCLRVCVEDKNRAKAWSNPLWLEKG